MIPILIPDIFDNIGTSLNVLYLWILYLLLIYLNLVVFFRSGTYIWFNCLTKAKPRFEHDFELYFVFVLLNTDIDPGFNLFNGTFDVSGIIYYSSE